MSKRGWILAASLAAIFGTHQAFAAGAFTLTSSDFKDGDRLPQKLAGNAKANPNYKPGQHCANCMQYTGKAVN